MLPVHAPEKQEECETCDLETCDAAMQEDVEAGTTGQWERPAPGAWRSVHKGNNEGELEGEKNGNAVYPGKIRPGPQLNE